MSTSIPKIKAQKQSDDKNLTKPARHVKCPFLFQKGQAQRN